MPLIDIPDNAVKVEVTLDDGTVETYRAQKTIDFVKENDVWKAPNPKPKQSSPCPECGQYNCDPESVGHYRG